MFEIYKTDCFMVTADCPSKNLGIYEVTLCESPSAPGGLVFDDD